MKNTKLGSVQIYYSAYNDDDDDEHSLPWNFRSSGAKVPRTFIPWNFRSSGANVPRTFVPMKRSYHENEYSKNFRSKCSKTRPINLTTAYVH